jgi:hypothetical protein
LILFYEIVDVIHIAPVQECFIHTVSGRKLRVVILVVIFEKEFERIEPFGDESVRVPRGNKKRKQNVTVSTLTKSLSKINHSGEDLVVLDYLKQTDLAIGRAVLVEDVFITAYRHPSHNVAILFRQKVNVVRARCNELPGFGNAVFGLGIVAVKE